MAASSKNSVAGRFRLEKRLAADAHSVVWQGSDVVDGSAVRVVQITGPLRDSVLDAAVRARVVDDPRVPAQLAVVRPTADDTSGYVVTRAPSGTTLLNSLTHGPMPAHRARTVVGEVAAAVAAAEAAGVHHGHLLPEHVVLGENDAVSVLDLGVAGALADVDDTRAGESDLRSLFALLYASLTALWPAADHGPRQQDLFGSDPAAVEESVGLPPAPMVAGVPVAPAQVLPGVPEELSSLCESGLSRRPSGVRSASDLHARLAPPTALTDDTVAISAIGPADDEIWVEPTPEPEPAADESDTAAFAPVAAARAGVHPEARAWPLGAPVTAQSAQTDQTAQTETSSAAGQATPPAATADDASTRPPVVAATPVAPVEDSPPVGAAEPADQGVFSGLRGELPAGDRGAFSTGGPQPGADTSDDATVRLGKTKMGGAVAAVGAAAGARKAALMSGESGARVRAASQTAQRFATRLHPDIPRLTPDEKRSRTRVVVGILSAGMALALILSIFSISRLFTSNTVASSSPAPSAAASSAAAAAPAKPVIASVTVDDSLGDKSENDDRAKNLIDGNADTTWRSSGYKTAEFGGTKKGLGLLVTLRAPAAVNAVTLTHRGEGGKVEIRVGPQGTFEGSARVGNTVNMGNSTTTVKFATPLRASRFLVWFTELPRFDGAYRLEISQLTVS